MAIGTPKQRLAAAAAVAGVSVFVLGAHLLRAPRGAPSLPSSSLARDSRLLRESSRAGGLVERHVRREAADEPERSVPSGSREIVQRPPLPSDMPVPPSEDERRAYADSLFESEATDRGWAVGAERFLNATLEAASIEGVTVDAVECRSTLCRVSVRHSGLEEETEFIQKLVYAPTKWRGAFMFVREATEAGEADDEPGTDAQLVVYLTREGTPIPEPSVQL